jgi:hypothetical protein
MKRNISVAGPMDDFMDADDSAPGANTTGITTGPFGMYPRTQAAGQLEELTEDPMAVPPPSGLPGQF